MSGLYQSAFRGYLIDHHSPAPPAVTLEHLDIAEYRSFFRTAGISSLMLYCKDHWGYSYYDTDIGTQHPALKQDWVAAVSKVLREESIELNAYYCLEYDSLAPDIHPEWSILDAKGGPVSLKGRMAKWGMPCYETGYREYVLGQLAEIVRNYHPDSLFLDIFGKSLCYCPACRAKFQEKFGYRDVARMEPYLTGRKLVAEVAILQSDRSSAAKAGNRVVMNAIGRCKQSDPHREAMRRRSKAGPCGFHQRSFG